MWIIIKWSWFIIPCTSSIKDDEHDITFIIEPLPVHCFRMCRKKLTDEHHIIIAVIVVALRWTSDREPYPYRTDDVDDDDNDDFWITRGEWTGLQET